MEDIMGFLAVCAGLMLMVILAIFGISAIFYYGATKPACEQYGMLESAEIHTRFFGAGCLVKYEGRWVDYDVAVRKKQEIKVTK